MSWKITPQNSSTLASNSVTSILVLGKMEYEYLPGVSNIKQPGLCLWNTQ